VVIGTWGDGGMSPHDKTVATLVIIGAVCIPFALWGLPPAGFWPRVFRWLQRALRTTLGTAIAILARGWLLATHRNERGQRYAWCSEIRTEERSYDAACEELHKQDMAEARERHPVGRLSARWKPVPCEPRGLPLTAAEAEALAALWWSIRNETAQGDRNA
jgi:hypothetical protein